jgi:signal transduction histidine kinase
VICFLVLIRGLTTSERFLVQLIPAIPWAFHYRLEYLSYFLLLPAFGYYLRGSFPLEFPRTPLLFNAIVVFLFAAIVLVTPVRFFSRILIGFQLYTVVTLIFGAGALSVAVRRRREGSIAMTVGFLLFVVVVVNDLLSATGIIRSMFLTPIGLFIFIILQSGFLTLQYSRAFETIDRQRAELYKHRAGLEKLVAERTRKLEEAMRVAEQANAAKSDFLAHMSHELRTPLNHIYGFAQLLAGQKIGALNDKQREFLRDILNSGKHLLGLIDRVLDLTKVEAGRMEMDRSEYRLGEIVAESTTMLTGRAQSAGVSFSTEGFENVPPLYGDRMKIKQVIINILDNALKFSPDGGEVRISASLEEEGKVTVRIADSGIGIEEAHYERVFEPMEQLSTIDSGRYSGAGLGMALARRYIELHRGKLTVWSEGLGKGTTFTIILPV